MSTSQLQHAQRKQALRANRIAYSPDPVAICAVTALLLSSNASRVFFHFTGGPSEYLLAALLVGGLGGLLLRSRSFFRVSQALSKPNHVILAVFAVCIIAVLSFTCGGSGVGHVAIDFEASMLKTFLLCTVLVLFVAASQGLHERDLEWGLWVFVVAELLACVAFPRIWNPNIVSTRVMTACLIAFSLSPRRIWRVAFLAFGLVVAFYFQCRTIMMATLIAISLITFTEKVGKNKSYLWATFFLLAAVFLVFGTDIKSALKDTARRSLGSTNPISRFFLGDKNVNDINGDFFDRQQIWDRAIHVIYGSPLVGYGLGNEEAIMGGHRAHNAFFSIAIEYGVLGLLAWGFLYFEVFYRLIYLNQKSGSLCRDRLRYCASILLLVLLLSGLMESSGLASIGTPSHLVLLLIVFSVGLGDVGGQKQPVYRYAVPRLS